MVVVFREGSQKVNYYDVRELPVIEHQSPNTVKHCGVNFHVCTLKCKLNLNKTHAFLKPHKTKTRQHCITEVVPGFAILD